MKTASIIIQPIVSVIGIFLLWLSFAMLIPGLLDFFEGNQNWVGFFVSSVFTFFMGVSFILMNRGIAIKIEVKSAFMLVVLSWFSLSIFASLPFITSTQNFSLTDAFFESVSGLTTTGSTIINDIENSLSIISTNSSNIDIRLNNLPTSQPQESGRLWNENGFLRIKT